MFKLFARNLTMVEKSECSLGFSIYALYYSGLSDPNNDHIIWAASQNIIWVFKDKSPCRII